MKFFYGFYCCQNILVNSTCHFIAHHDMSISSIAFTIFLFPIGKGESTKVKNYIEFKRKNKKKC